VQDLTRQQVLQQHAPRMRGSTHGHVNGSDTAPQQAASLPGPLLSYASQFVVTSWQYRPYQMQAAAKSTATTITAVNGSPSQAL
jgi:hypothetical protein